jgi:hypothetical protein
MVTKAGLLVSAVVVLLATACESTGGRRPERVVEAVENFQTLRIVDVAVLPVKAVPAELSIPLRVAFREDVVKYLVDKKSYSVADLAYVDETLGPEAIAAAGLDEARGKLNEDAILTIRIDQWDDRFLISSERIHAGGEFALHASDTGVRLWRFAFRDEPISVSGRSAPADAQDLEREAVRKLIALAIDTLPDKPKPMAPKQD